MPTRPAQLTKTPCPNRLAGRYAAPWVRTLELAHRDRGVCRVASVVVGRRQGGPRWWLGLAQARARVRGGRRLRRVCPGRW
jgi:hypothetical protein